MDEPVPVAVVEDRWATRIGFVAALFHLWWVTALGGVIIIGALVDWFWPRRVHADMEAADD